MKRHDLLDCQKHGRIPILLVDDHPAGNLKTMQARIRRYFEEFPDAMMREFRFTGHIGFAALNTEDWLWIDIADEMRLAQNGHWRVEIVPLKDLMNGKDICHA